MGEGTSPAEDSSSKSQAERIPRSCLQHRGNAHLPKGSPNIVVKLSAATEVDGDGVLASGNPNDGRRGGEQLCVGGKVLHAQCGAHDDELERGDLAPLLRHLLAQRYHPRQQPCASKGEVRDLLLLGMCMPLQVP